MVLCRRAPCSSALSSPGRAATCRSWTIAARTAPRQHVIATLGRLDELAARGSLAALLASGARYCDQILALSALADEDSAARLSARRLGGPLLFGRLWQDLGLQAVLEEPLQERAFRVPARTGGVRERAASPVRVGLRSRLRAVDAG